MNSMQRWTTVILAALALSPGLAEGPRVEILSERVNLRAKPRAEAEVAGQVGRGDILEQRGTNMEWVAVAPPTNVSLWVASEFIKDNKVGTDKLNVRAGAGISYPVVGTIYKDELVVPRSQMGQWMEIVPPSNAVLWVHRDYVKMVIDTPAPVAQAPVVPPAPSEPATPVLAQEPPAAPAVPKKGAVVPVPEEPEAPVPPDLNEQGLVPLAGQGEPMEREGTLHKTSFFDFGKISNYCLIDWERGRPVTVCYIRGNNAQLKTFDGRRLRIKGEGYWLKGSSKPVLVPRQIMPLAAKDEQ